MLKRIVGKVRFAPSVATRHLPRRAGEAQSPTFPVELLRFPVGSPAKPSPRAGRLAQRAGWGGFQFMTSGENSFLFTAQVENVMPTCRADFSNFPILGLDFLKFFGIMSLCQSAKQNIVSWRSRLVGRGRMIGNHVGP